MVLKSEAAAMKYVSDPPRDRKYCIVAYSRLLVEYPNMPQDTYKEVVNALIEASCPTTKSADF